MYTLLRLLPLPIFNIVHVYDITTSQVESIYLIKKEKKKKNTPTPTHTINSLCAGC